MAEHDFAMPLSKQQELVAVATAISENAVDWLEGIRRICDLRFAVSDPDNPAFLTIIAVESETDMFPAGVTRLQCSDEYLERVDSEMKKYWDDRHADILRACNDIVSVFSHA